MTIPLDIRIKVRWQVIRCRLFHHRHRWSDGPAHGCAKCKVYFDGESWVTRVQVWPTGEEYGR